MQTTTSRITPHFTQDIAPHFTCSTSCIIPPHLTVITPIHPTTMFRVTFHITHQYTTTFHISPTTAYHILHTTPTTTYRAVSQPTLPRSTSHNVLHSMPQHTYQSILHHNFHNPIPVSEARNYMWSVLLFHSHTTFYTTYQTQHKNHGGREKVQLC